MGSEIHLFDDFFGSFQGVWGRSSREDFEIFIILTGVINGGDQERTFSLESFSPSPIKPTI